MTVTLHPNLQRLIEDRVRAGDFSSVDEAVNKLLTFVLEQKRHDDETLAQLKAEIAVGLADEERGAVFELGPEEIWDEVERRYMEETKKGGLMARVQHTAASRRDFADIIVYLRPQSRQGARRVYLAIQETLSLLAENPEMGATRDDLTPGMRSFPVSGYRHYLIFYRPIADGIRALRILHGARNLPRFF